MTDLTAQPTEILEMLLQDEGRVFYRSVTSVDRSPLLVLAIERPTAQSLRRLQHEYAHRDELDAAWAARPLALVGDHGRSMLVLADPGGILLSRLIGEPWEISSFIRAAIGIAVALRRLHQHGLIHKDIKPEHVLVDVGTGAAWLTGFGIASRLKREHQVPDLPEMIAGTLAYMAPEQTGRINRSIDARSDLYAFGITLYQMLTGVLPFNAVEPMEMIHCHIARHPLPPQERVAGVPAPLSAIVLKLLAKTAEERYQTAGAVEADLRRCLEQWRTHSRMDIFGLGVQEVSDRLLIPEKLYGREREIDILHSAFGRVVASGTPELVLVGGYSGIGKSSVVHELHKALVAPRGLFVSGKFDQYKRDIPYATLAQAFQSVIHPLLGQSEMDLGRWRDALREALGPNGQLMVNLIPELELVMGNQPPVPELPAQDAQNRFQMVFRRFLSVFARPEHPLVLFLDDLQWLDAGTLDLLQQLVSEPEVRHLLLVGSYRDNEVGPDHVLTRKLAAIRRSGVRIQEIVLAPLALDDVNRLVCDSLHCAREVALPLAQLVHEKTAGNPFFAIQFIGALAEEGLLAFEPASSTWTWDLERIRAKGFAENVVDLMIGKLHRLPAPTREVLEQLACLGNVAELATLARIHGGAEEAIGTALWEALHAGFIVCLGSAYKFVHDRIEEAAYALIPVEKRAAVHLRIGRTLAAQTPPERLEEKVFEIANQCNRAIALITAQEEREQVAELNLIAGRRAKASTAYASALNYFAAAAALLGDDWNRYYSLLFGSELQRAECESLSGELVAAEERLCLLAVRAMNLVDHAAVTCLRVRLYTALNQSDRAVAVSLEYLRRVGVAWDPHPTQEEVADELARLWRQLDSRSIRELVDLPAMKDPRWRATMDVLSDARRTAQFTDQNLYRILLGRMANLSLEHGNSDGSCVAYAWLGLALGPWLGEHAVGRRFGELSLDLVDQHGLDRFKTRVYLCFGSSSWAAHPDATLAFLQRAFERAQNTGDLTGTAYAYNVVIAQRLVNGHSLHELHPDAERALAFVQKGRFGVLIEQITGHVRLIRALRGLASAFGSFTDATFDERQFEQHLQSNPGLRLAGCWYWIRKLQARCYAGDYAAAIEAASEAQRLLWTTQSHFEIADYHFYAALAHAGSWVMAPGEVRQQHLEAVIAHQQQLSVWSQHAPEHFANRAALLSAEVARLQGRDLDAGRLYEEAIRLARKHGFVQNEAIANELTARFYAARGSETIANGSLRAARNCYLQWGAEGKVRQLEQLHPQLRDERGPLQLTTTVEARQEQLDFATVVKMSQTLSGEIILDKLIETLMQIAVEHAGAERGLLVLQRGGEQRIEAEATTGREMVVRLLGTQPSPAELPDSILQHVVRTRESVILDDACAQNPFSEDEYIRHKRPRSLLCLALVNQARLIGVLYLENRLASHVFTRARYSVLSLLSSQAAISLENARLYAELTAENIERRRSDDALRREVLERQRTEQLARMDEMRFRRFFDLPLIGMAVTSPERRFLEVNEKLCQILGYPREELLGRDWASITHPDDLSGNLGLLDEAMAGASETYSMDKRYIHRDGQIVYVSISVCCVRRTDGTADHFVLTVQDVTARHQVQEQLERTEAHLRHGQQIARLASYEVYPPGLGDVRWSEQVYTMIGLDPGSPVPQMAEYIERFVHPDDREYMHEAALRRANADHRFVMEYRIVRPDGALRYMQSITDPVKDESGRIVKLVGTLLDMTERKLVEEALRESEERFALAVAGSNVGIFDWDLATDQVFLSVRAQELCGIEPGEPWRSRPKWSTIFQPLPEDLELNRRAIRAHLAGETPACDVEYRLMLPSGDLRWFRHRGLALRDATGKAYRMAGSIEDITERKRVEEAQARHARQVALRADVHAAFSRAADPLQQVLRRAAEAIVHNLDGALARIWTLDQDKGVLELRASAGLYTQLDGPDSRIPFGHLMIGKIAQDRAPHVTNDVINDPGVGDRDWVQQEAIVAFVGVPLLIEGRVAGVVAMFAQHPLESDTVEAFEAIADTIAQGIGRRRAEEALRGSEQRFRDYAESASDWLWETGPDHRFTWFSLRTTGVYHPDNRIGIARWEVAVDVDEEPEKWRLHIATLDAHEPFRGFMYRTVQGDGSIAYLAVSGKPVFDAQGGFQGYRGAASDVTAAVRADHAEKALHQAQADLAHVARVTSLGALTASIAHEVNQPLTGIINNAGTCLRMLAADPPNIDGARETTRRTLRDGNRASEVITRLRTLFSKKDAVMDAVDLNEATREVIAMSLSELQRGHLIARLELADDLPPVAGDRVQLQQVILNLLLNAADAMRAVEDRPRQLVIKTQHDEGDRVRLSIQDVGVGLDPQIADKLFDAFFTTKSDGMGIGLSVSRSIIERHHGRLWAAPNDGPGATFSFSIPCASDGVTASLQRSPGQMPSAS